MAFTSFTPSEERNIKISESLSYLVGDKDYDDDVGVFILLSRSSEYSLTFTDLLIE